MEAAVNVRGVFRCGKLIRLNFIVQIARYYDMNSLVVQARRVGPAVLSMSGCDGLHSHQAAAVFSLLRFALPFLHSIDFNFLSTWQNRDVVSKLVEYQPAFHLVLW